MDEKQCEAPSAEERAILDLLAQGLTDEAVARRLGLARRTYRRRLRAVMDKLAARSRFEAGVEAARRGWIESQTGFSGHDRTEEPTSRGRTTEHGARQRGTKGASDE